MAGFEVITYGRFWVTAEGGKASGTKDAQREMQKIARNTVLFTIDLLTDWGLHINGSLLGLSGHDSRTAGSERPAGVFAEHCG